MRPSDGVDYGFERFVWALGYTKTLAQGAQELLADVEPAVLQAGKDLARRVAQHPVLVDFTVPPDLCEMLKGATVALSAILKVLPFDPDQFRLDFGWGLHCTLHVVHCSGFFVVYCKQLGNPVECH